MNPLNINDVIDYVEKNIAVFHQKRLDSLQGLKLDSVLKRKNPYLFKAKNVDTADRIVRGLVDAHLSSQEETIFGDWLEGLAIFVNERVYHGRKSGIPNIDLEFDKDNIRYIVSIKSGPNWGNSSQIKKLESDFKNAKKTLRTSNSSLHVVAVNGCCYGRDAKPDKGEYFKFCGQRFWEFISGSSRLFLDLIEPLGKKAKERNNEFDLAYAGVINTFTLEFLTKYCTNSGQIDWEKIVKMNSAISKNVLPTPLNFLEEIIEADLSVGKHQSILTRFPPEPNGYLHIGHATSICLNFGIAKKYGGQTNLRFDDTNPLTEDTEYVDSIIADVRWLGFEPANILYASDYFEQLYEWAKVLILKGKAYVDFSSSEEMAALKGTPTEPGKDSPYRNTSPEENLVLFEKMRAGAFPDGHCTLRAKIDMSSSNMIMRDPLLYRIKHAHHHRTGNDWCIYPMYDWAHGQSDSIEKITHSICTLEFAPHRELYDWCIEQLGIFPSKQYEFARRNVSYAITSKRKLKLLVEENHVRGWDDPRMPTISGFRRRGFTPASIREFCDRIGLGKREMVADMSLLEFCIREDLNKIALRRFAVLNPLKVVITNYPANQTEQLETENNPEAPETGNRPLSFGPELWIEQDDFMENPPPKYFRLSPGGMVRLKSAYIIRCDSVLKDAAGKITEIHCSYVPESRSGQDTSGLKPKGVIHWLSASDAVQAEVRLYDRLFQVEDPASEEDFISTLNPNSLQVIENALVEPALAVAAAGDKFQFTRLGYFCVDPDSRPGKMVFNRTVTLKDAWAKAQQ